MNTTELNDAQASAVASESDLILCLAGPGSGKTRTLVRRVKHIMCLRSVPPQQIVVITFTNAAADELASRLGPVDIGYCGTLHGFMLKLVERWSHVLGYASSSLTVLDSEQADALLDRAMKELSYNGPIKKVTDALRTAIDGKAKRDFELVALRYVNLLRAHNLITFDTILLIGLKLLNWMRSEGKALHYTHLFVDEFQDSADLDAEIYRAMALKKQFYVGDPDQSIFGFRGGKVDNILGLAWRADCETIRLETNYRSGWRICRTAQKLISCNFNRVAKETLPAEGSQGGSVSVRAFERPMAEMSNVVKLVSNFHSEGKTVAVLLRSGVLVTQWCDFLEGSVPIRRAKKATRPADWPLVRAILAVLHDPTNEWAILTVLVAKHGESVANGIRLEAHSKGTRLTNETLSLPRQSVPSEYGQILARQGASAESIAIVESARETLPASAAGSDLLMAIAQSETSNQEEGEGVTVSTYHSAKGREFDVVFLPAFEEEIIPGKAKTRSIEEERRLAYVGITRAREAVFISYCEERTPDFGFTPQKVTPSRFIREAGL